MKPVGYLTNSLTGLEGEPGIFYSYITAADGMYLRTKNDRLNVTVNIADVQVRGLAPVAEEITLIHGKIPMYLFNLALSILMAKPDTEQFIAFVWENGKYCLKQPTQTGTGGSVQYETWPNTVLDLHSHTGGIPAQFSIIDDRDEQGLGLYGVVAALRNLFPTSSFRLGCYGYFLEVEKGEIFEQTTYF